MKTCVHENSKEAFRNDYMDSAQIKDKILEYSMTVRSFTDKMAAQYVGKDASTITSKRRELLRDGLLGKEIDKHPCKITGHNAMYFYNPNFNTQMRLI